jgi:hypothetical protein
MTKILPFRKKYDSDQGKSEASMHDAASDDNNYRDAYLRHVGYKPVLEITETRTYNIEGTWGHTRPCERIIVMLPPELRDYRLPVEDHEITHNAFPNLRNENYVTEIARGPMMPYVRGQFEYRRRCA